MLKEEFYIYFISTISTCCTFSVFVFLLLIIEFINFLLCLYQIQSHQPMDVPMANTLKEKVFKKIGKLLFLFLYNLPLEETH